MIRQELERFVDMLKKARKIAPPGLYWCGEDFVLRNGREFKERSPLPNGRRRGPMKACFRNAWYLANDVGGMIYVEGYATTSIVTWPTLHAWCVDNKGRVVDPTWKDGIEYFGVPFTTSYVNRTILARKHFGVIDNWEEHFPLLTGKHKRFLCRKGMNDERTEVEGAHKIKV